MSLKYEPASEPLHVSVLKSVEFPVADLVEGLVDALDDRCHLALHPPHLLNARRLLIQGYLAHKKQPPPLGPP